MIIARPHAHPHPDDWQYEDPNARLREMSFPRKEVENQLSRWVDTLHTHLLKIFYYRDDTRNMRGWIVTVYKCAFRTAKVKAPKGKKDYILSAEDIYELLWGGWNDTFAGFHRGTLEDFNCKSNYEYADLPYIHAGGNERSAHDFFRDYFVWLARQLSEKGKVNLDDVRSKIEALLRKYPL
jgi:hypothetical protein